MAIENNLSSRFLIPAAGAENPHSTELVIRKSKFVTHGCHCATDQDAKDFVMRMRGKFPDATHNCWAYVAGAPGDTSHIGSSDDGEPRGTAGKPMLNALLHSGIGQVCMVVSRWFGGIKLGTGGLARAYQQAVMENLATLPRKEAVKLKNLQICLPYASLPRLRREMDDMEARILSEEYGSRVKLQMTVPGDRYGETTHRLLELTNGSCEIYEIGAETSGL